MSPNHKVYVAITVHFENKGVPISMLLDIVEIAHSHSSFNLATVFVKILEDFGVSEKANSSYSRRTCFLLTRHA